MMDEPYWPDIEERCAEPLATKLRTIKALTISEPFASLIAAGHKWVENRTWRCDYRGWLAIHAGKGTQYLTRAQLRSYPSGCVVAVARLSAIVPVAALRKSSRIGSIGGRPVGEILDHEHCEGPMAWILNDVRRLVEPVPARGAQGLWDWTLNDEARGIIRYERE